MAASHPLHVAVADEIRRCLSDSAELIADPACGGSQHVPLFMGAQRGRDTRMCLVDALVVASGRVKVIVEIEESGFIPTKICGKFLTSALATHFIHDSRMEGAVPYDEYVLFLQVLDGSKFLKVGTRKDAQAELIEHRIREMLPLPGSTVSDYRLVLALGPSDADGLAIIGRAVRDALR
jgi:hypothetical protein